MSTFLRSTLTALLSSFLFSCGASRADDSMYREVWNEVINSPEWKASLEQQPADTTNRHPYLPLGAEEMPGSVTMDQEFIARYHSLVNQAYFRLIKQAEKADENIRKDYQETRKAFNQGAASAKDLEEAKDRFKAHAFMLEGLKSWKAFRQERTADLEFFRAENIIDIYNMLQLGYSENEVIRYLMLELADLYHIEERSAME